MSDDIPTECSENASEGTGLDANSDPDQDLDTNPGPDQDSDTNPGPDQDSDTNPGPDQDSDTNPERDQNSDTNPERDQNSDALDGEHSPPTRSAVSDELNVPSSPPDPAESSHVLPDEKLHYPTFEFDSGTVSPSDGFDLSRELDREEMCAWLADLEGSINSHDAAVEGENTRVTFGVKPDDVRMRFVPDDDHRGRLEVTFTLDAKALLYEDGETRPAGARGGRGFIPFEMLTEDRDPRSFRCYNWIRDPVNTTEDSAGDVEDSAGDVEEGTGDEEDSAGEAGGSRKSD